MKSKWQAAGMFAMLLVAGVAILTHSSPKVSAASEGKITGTIKLNGTPPHQKPIDMSKEPSCQAQHAAKPVTTENVVVGSNGGLANVVVYISDGLSPAAAAQVPSQPAEINQKGCQYIPHVVVLDTNQDMKVVNSDQTSHNIHPLPTKNSQWNKSQPPNTPPFDAKFTTEEVAIPVKCNIHPWMHGYIAVVKGPYGISNDSGTYTIDGVPPGNYTITAWQEEYGTQTAKVTVAAGKPGTADFTFKAK
jgi:plastocyanin